MSILPQVRPKNLLKALQKEGFVISRKTGSHIHLKHANGRLTSVSIHPGTIPKGTLKAILSQTKLPLEKLKKLL